MPIQKVKKNIFFCFQIKSLAHVLLCNVESLTSPDIQRRISKLKISYIAVDEAQVWFGLTLAVHKTLLLRKVADPETGWDFRPYSPVLWRWLALRNRERQMLGQGGRDGSQAAFVILL